MKKYFNLTIIVLFLSLQIFAAQYVFNVNDGNWNVPGNWSGGVLPTAADQPIIPAGRTISVNTDVGECNVIFCGQSVSSPRWGMIKMYYGSKLSAPILILGRDEDNHGIFWISGGELSLSGYLSVGDNDGGPSGSTARGTLNISAGSLKMLGSSASYIGFKGVGEMTVSGNGAFYANNIIVGENVGSEGSEMKIIGGSVIANNITLGNTATSDGKMTISGGKIVWSNQFYIRDTLTIQHRKLTASSPEAQLFILITVQH